MESLHRKGTIAGAGFGAVLLGFALLAPPGAARADDDGPELDKQRVATCEARGGRLARNHLGQMLCKDAKVKLKVWLEQHPETAAAPAPAIASPPAPGVTAPPPAYAPASSGTHTVQAGAPQVPPPPKPIDLPGGMGGAGGTNGTGGIGGTGGGQTPPVLAPPIKTGATCALRSCLYSSYSKSCQCQQFNSPELCQFKETTPGGKCADPNGYTTALCPAGYSCINNSCRKEPTC